MIVNEDIQQKFFSIIKEKIGSSVSFVDELADALNISKDSAYRRIRGETSLDFSEIAKLCDQYKISLDALLNQNSSTVSFNVQAIDGETLSFKDYFNSILEKITILNQFGNSELYYGAKDIPIMHYFRHDELGWFKIFFWMKTYLQDSKYRNAKFDPEKIDKELIGIGKKIWMGYRNMTSIEIWSKETIILTMHQILYYLDTGILPKVHALKLVDQYQEMVGHIQQQCEMARKFEKGHADKKEGGKYNVYVNEIASPDNNIFFKMGNNKVAMITYNTLNTLSTSNQVFCDQIEHFFDDSIRKSILISGTSEKERNKFFNHLNDQIDVFRMKVELRTL